MATPSKRRASSPGRPASSGGAAQKRSTSAGRTAAKGSAAPTSKKPGIRLLGGVPLFSGLSQAHLRQVASLAEEIAYSPGRMIVRTGSPGIAFYVIVDGRAKVLRGKIASAQGTWLLGPGDFFGEMALLDGGPRTASVVAETPLTTIRIERAGFRKMLKEEPEIALKLLEAMASRMRGMLDHPPL